MKKWIILTIMVLVLIQSAMACKELYNPNEQVIISDVIETTGSGADCNITIYSNNTFIQSAWMENNGLTYNYSAGQLDGGIYVANIECNLSTATYLSECKFTVESDGEVIVAALIIIPMFLGFMILLGSFFLGDDHKIFKTFLFLLSVIPFFISMHFGMISVVEFYDWTEMQDLIGSTTYWFGILFAFFVTYFIIYSIYKLTMIAAQKKNEEIEY